MDQQIARNTNTSNKLIDEMVTDSANDVAKEEIVRIFYCIR